MSIMRSCYNMYCMKKSYQEMIDFIKAVGLYPQFVAFSTATPYIKSKRRKAYLFLVQKDKWKLFRDLPCSFERAYEVCRL